MLLRIVIWTAVYVITGGVIGTALGLVGIHIRVNEQWQVFVVSAVIGWGAWWVIRRTPVWGWMFRSTRQPTKIVVRATSYREATTMALAEGKRLGFVKPYVDNYGSGEEAQGPWVDGSPRDVWVVIAEED